MRLLLALLSSYFLVLPARMKTKNTREHARGARTRTAQIVEETSSVSLHSKEIYIIEASFVPAAAAGATAAAKPLEASAISFDLKLTTATFTFPEPLAKGRGTLKLSFQCDINNQVRSAMFLFRGGVAAGMGRVGFPRGRRGRGGSRCSALERFNFAGMAGRSRAVRLVAANSPSTLVCVFVSFRASWVFCFCSPLVVFTPFAFLAVLAA